MPSPASRRRSSPVSVGKGEDESAGRGSSPRNPPLAFYSEPSYALAFALKPPIAGMPTTILYDRRGSSARGWSAAPTGRGPERGR